MDCERGCNERDDRGNHVEEEDDAMVGDCRLAHDINFDYYSSSGTTSIYRLADPNNATFGGRTGSVAVKVVVFNDGQPLPSTDPQRTVSRLYNEYILSRRPNSLLSKCGSVRAALRLEGHGHGHAQEDGRGDGGGGPHDHAIYLEWADGVTLRDWIRRRSVSVAGPCPPLLPSPSPSPSSRSAAALVGAVRLAWHVAGAISEVHEAGVVHNSITTDNIIVDDSQRNYAPGEGVGDQWGWGETNGEGGGITVRTETDFSVKVIDLASAAILRENDPAGSARAIEGDLLALGHVLFEIFFSGGGRDSDPESFSHHHRLGQPQTKDDGPVESLMRNLDNEGLLLDDNRMPRCITTLVTELMGRGGKYGGHRYRSAAEVQLDLSQILDYPDRFLAKWGSPDDDGGGGAEESMSGGGALHFSPDRLYGRATETSLLLEATSRVIGTAGGPTGRSEVVLVSGTSGSGKSSLVRTALMRQSLIRGGGGYYLLSGKFDSLRQVESISAIIDAFAEFCQLIITGEGGGSDDGSNPEVIRIRRAIMDEVGPDGASVLADLIPGVGRLLGVDPGTTGAKVGGKEGKNRLRHVLRLFVRAIAAGGGPPPRHRRPLVLFLDDLQWADTASLDLVRALVADGDGGGPLLFIGCYRDNEVDRDHALAVQLREMMESKVVPVTTIRIGNIGGDSMNHMISDAMGELRSCTVPLTDAVQHKTNGNPFFAMEVLFTFLDDGLLKFSDAAGSWEWDAGGIQAKNVADTAFELVVKKILRLPADVRGALQVAACLGHHCEESTLCLIEDEGAGVTQALDGNSCGLDCECINGGGHLAQMLDRAAKQGFLEKTGSKFEFVHDQIQHATYASIPEYERGMLHQRIGKRIWKKSPPEQLEALLFVAADQLYLGSTFVDEADRLALAWLYLRAGKKAMASSLFLPAATYLKAGTVLLAGPSCWDHQYDLSLQLYVSCAETYFYNGSFDAMGEMLDEIFANAQSFDDKLGAYGTLVNSLGSMDKVQAAIKTTFLVLEELGEHFPEPEDASDHVVSNWLITRDMLEEYTDETLVTMQIMKDERKIAAMSFLKTLILYTYMAAQQYLPLVTFRMMQVTLRYGLCKESAFAFAMYGIISCGSFDDIDRGYQFGQLALQLLERFDGKNSVAQVYVAIYGNINHWKEPLRLSLEPLLRGHQVGLMLGDIEYGMVNARLFCLLSFQCGKQLAPLEEEMRVFCDGMAQYNQMTILAFVAITRQTVQNLMGLSDDALELTGEAMNQKQMLENATMKKNSLISCCIYYHRMWLAYYFGNYELAANLAEKSRNVNELCTGEFVVANHAFFDGLTSLALSRKSEDSKWRDLAKQALKRMKNWAVYAPRNFAHKVALLEAESAFLSEAHSLAGRKYDSAIALAGENGFVNEQALACERAAIFYSEVGDKPRASAFYDKAHDLYLEWGARGKALHLRDQSLSFFMADTT